MSAASDGAQPPAPPGRDSTPAQAPDETLVLAGRIEESGFADILRSLLRSRETAVVELTRQGAKKTVWVQDGRILFAGSSDPDERLGEAMLREGLIDVEKYDESSRMIRPGKRQGTILVELGHVTPDDLVHGVTAQVTGIVMDLFRWRTGNYRIEMRPFSAEEIIVLNLSTEKLVFNGVRAGAGWSQIRRGLAGGLETVLAHAADADARLWALDLGEDDMHVYTLATGRLTVGQICSMSWRSSFDTCLTLYGLACCAILVAVGDDADARERASTAQREGAAIRARIEGFNAAYAPIAQAIAERIGEDVLLLHEHVLSVLVDEHYDVLRDVRLAPGLPIETVLENVEAIAPGWRSPVVDRAVAALEAELATEGGAAVGPGAEQQIAAAFASARRTS